MGGFFGAVCKHDAVADIFFGVDYHSHLGTRRGGVAACNEEIGLQREIHSIENSPFRTKFDDILDKMHGNAAIGCISDFDPQPLLFHSHLGTYAMCMIGVINNADDLMNRYLKSSNSFFNVMTGGTVNSVDLLAALINQKDSFEEGIRFAQENIDGTASILILTNEGKIIAARDYWGRLPLLVGQSEDGCCTCFESFAFEKLGYEYVRNLGPAEVVEITADGITQLLKPREEMKLCSFMWTYYGFPTSTYENVNVELMRNRNGQIMAQNDSIAKNAEDIDSVSGVPDSGTAHAIGYANESGVPFTRPFIKYTPTWARSFTPTNQAVRNRVAKMKQIPVNDLIKDKNLLFIDDSIVRGTQLRETVEFLYSNGAKSVHMRSACPPIMYSCKYLNFSRANSPMELITRKTIMELEGEEGFNHIEEYSDSSTERGQTMRKAISEKFKFASLEFQTLDGLIKSIGLEPCKLCTYCWNGKE